jgi:hypothetical protein
MPYIAPDSISLDTSLLLLKITFPSDSTKRVKERALLDAVKKHTVLSKPIIGALILVEEGIYKSYNYLSPTRSNLYNALIKALGIGERNPMSVNDKVFYLNELRNSLFSDASIELTNTDYKTVAELRTAIEQCMVDLLLRSNPSLFAAASNSSFTSFITNIPNVIGSTVNSFFSTTVAEEKLSIECRDIIVKLPDNDVTAAVKPKMLSISATYPFSSEEPQHQQMNNLSEGP